MAKAAPYVDPDWNHGSPSTYNNNGCRCDACTEAWRIYMRPRVKASRERKRAREQAANS